MDATNRKVVRQWLNQFKEKGNEEVDKFLCDIKAGVARDVYGCIIHSTL